MEAKLKKNKKRRQPEECETPTGETPGTNVGVNTDRDSDTSVGTQGTTDTISAGVTQLGLQAKKLSGAQRKKILKAKKIAAGTWTTENPHKNCSKPDEKKGNKRTSGSRGKEDLEGKKRPRDDSKTPPQITKKPRSTNKQTGPYSEIVSGLRMAVIDRRHPEVTLDQEQADLIQNKLVAALDDAPSGSGSPIQFTRTTFSGGVLWLTCANEFTKTWLRGAVSTLGNLWEGADLTSVESKDLPKRPRVLVSIPGDVEPEEAVRTRLGRQNPGLRVGGWLLISRKVEREGSILAYSIDEVSYNTLVKNQLRAFYRLGRVIFRVLKGLDGGHQGASSEPPTQ